GRGGTAGAAVPAGGAFRGVSPRVSNTSTRWSAVFNAKRRRPSGERRSAFTAPDSKFGNGATAVRTRSPARAGAASASRSGRARRSVAMGRGRRVLEASFDRGNGSRPGGGPENRVHGPGAPRR